MSHWTNIIPSDWGIETLADSVCNVVDNRGKTCPIAETGIPLIATNCIKEFALYPVFEKVRYVDNETYTNWFRGHPKPNDILFVNKGTPGGVCVVPNPVPFCIAQDMVALRADPEKFDWKFLFAALRSRFVKSQIEALNVGTSIPHLKKTDFNRISIPKPKISDQKVIGEIYFSLSDKIELNLQMNKTLEEMAMALYKHWFVDFGPFRDGEFVSSELGEIPKGWEVKRLGDLISNAGSNRTVNSISENDKYIGLEHLERGSLSILTYGYGSDVESNKTGFLKGHILFGKLRPYFKKVGVAPFDGICSTDILVINPKNAIDFGYVLFTIFNDRFIDYTNTVSGGTRMPRVGWGDIQDYKIAFQKGGELSENFTKIVRPFIDQLLANVFEIQTLTTLRDTLLPKLISGEVRVKDVAKSLAEVL